MVSFRASPGPSLDMLTSPPLPAQKNRPESNRWAMCLWPPAHKCSFYSDFSTTPASSAPKLLPLSFVMGKFGFLSKKLRQRIQLQYTQGYVRHPERQPPRAGDRQGTLQKYRLQLFPRNWLKLDPAPEGRLSTIKNWYEQPQPEASLILRAGYMEGSKYLNRKQLSG